MSDSLWSYWLQRARLLCPPLSPKVCSTSCPLSWWCYLIVSSSVISFSSHLQSFSASGSFPRSQLFASGGQSIGASASASVLPMNIQNWFPLGWTGWISLQSKGLSRVFSNTTAQKHQFFGTQLSLWSNSHIHIHDSWKNHSFDYTDLVSKVRSLLFNMLSRLVIAFLPRSQPLFNFMFAITICSDFGALQNKASHCFYSFPIYLPWSDATRYHDLSFLNVEF